MSDFLFAHNLFASFFDLSAAYRHFTARLPAHSLIFLADTNAKMHFARNFFMRSATSTFESISSAAACALTRFAVQERFFIYLVSPLRHHNPISIQRTCSTQSLFNARTRCSSQLINVQTGLQSIQLGVNEEFKKGGGVGWVGVLWLPHEGESAIAHLHESTKPTATIQHLSCTTSRLRASLRQPLRQVIDCNVRG